MSITKRDIQLVEKEILDDLIRVCDENNIKYGDDIVKIITPLGYGGTAKYFRELGLEMPEDDILALMHKYAHDEYLYNIPAKENVIKILKELRSQGASLNILTASPHTMLDPCLERLGIFDLFTNVWSCDDFKTTKADPEIYKMAAEKIGENIEKILFLDDNFNADKTAKTAGMKVCGVYDDSSKDYIDEIKTISDYYIYDFSELSEIIRGQ